MGMWKTILEDIYRFAGIKAENDSTNILFVKLIGLQVDF